MHATPVMLELRPLDVGTSLLIVQQPGERPIQLRVLIGAPRLRCAVLAMPRWARGRQAIIETGEFGRFASMIRSLDAGPAHDPVLRDLLEIVRRQDLNPRQLGRRLSALSDQTRSSFVARSLRDAGFVVAGAHLEAAERLRPHMASVSDSMRVETIACQMDEALIDAETLGDPARAVAVLDALVVELDALCASARAGHDVAPSQA